MNDRMRSPNRVTLVVAGASATIIALWVLVAQHIVPSVIARAYREESLPILNGLMAGRKVYPLDLYQGLWTQIARRVTTALAALGVVSLIAARPNARAGLDARLQRFTDERLDARTIGMSAARMRRVNGAIAVLTLLSLIAIAADIEFWPFSNYPMYSDLSRPALEVLELFGVNTAGSEVALRDHAYIQPFRLHRLIQTLIRLDTIARRDVEVRAALNDVLERYAMLRQNGRHDGPQLTALRLYRSSWVADRRAADMMPLTRRELLLEVQATSLP